MRKLPPPHNPDAGAFREEKSIESNTAKQLHDTESRIKCHAPTNAFFPPQACGFHPLPQTPQPHPRRNSSKTKTPPWRGDKSLTLIEEV